MIVTISGQAGSGKSTVAGILAKRLGYKHYSVGDLRRKMAREKGLTLAELNRLGEKDDFTDKDVDEYQKGLGKTEDNFVIDSRLGFHFIPNSVKIYLDCELRERARRVFRDERTVEGFKNLGEVEKALEERERSDSFRYKKYYGVDCFDKSNYDLVIDTTRIPAKDVAEKILDFLGKKGKI
jgi:cytidylate kinase